MHSHAKFNTYFEECPGIAILRGLTAHEVPDICDALKQAGIKILEVPLNTPNALDVIKTAVEYCGNDQVVGAGTVITPEEVNAVAGIGGQFIISPNTDAEVIQATKATGLVSIPGFYTPSEAFQAQKAGADYLKLFPAGQISAAYINDLKTVMKLPIIATGGITLNNIPEFIKVCAGVGLASCLYRPGQNKATTYSLASQCAKLLHK